MPVWVSTIGERHRNALHHPAVINMILLLGRVFNWPIIMIRPGGLLLVVPHLFAVPVYGGVEK